MVKKLLLTAAFCVPGNLTLGEGTGTQPIITFGSSAYGGVPSLMIRSPFDQAALLRVKDRSSADRDTSVEGMSGQAVPLPIYLPADIRELRFIVVRGVPKEHSLSDGFRGGEAWFIPMDDDKGPVLLSSPPGFQGSLRLEITFYKDLSAGPLGNTLLTVNVRPAEVAQNGAGKLNPMAAARTKPQPSGQANEPGSSGIQVTAVEETELLRRGADLLRHGDVAAARLIFHDLAKRGSGKAARAMGESHDPVFLRRLFTAGLQPNVDEAKRWYQKALEMGDTEAAKRLAALRSP